MDNAKAFSELCLVSREGVCILDMGQVADKARELGLRLLPEIISRDLESNQIINGQYYPLVAKIYEVQS